MEAERRSHRVEAWNQSIGILLIAAAAALLIALVSYTPRDLPSWIPFNFAEPANERAENLLGRTGAIIAGALFFFFGAASFLLAALVLGLGVAKVLVPHSQASLKLMWAAAFIVLGACLIQIQPWYFHRLNDEFNIEGAGGWVGHLLGEELFAAHLGRWTSLAVLGVIYFFVLCLMLGIRPWRLPGDLAEARRRWREAQHRNRIARAGPIDRLELQKRWIEEERRRLLKDLERTGTEPGIPNLGEPVQETQAEEGVASGKEPAGIAPSKRAKPSHHSTAGRSVGRPLPYRCPDFALLDPPEPGESLNMDPAEVDWVRSTILATLQQFGIEVQAGPVTRGPAITRYEIYPPDGVRVDRIVSLEKDIARATRAERITILAPVPGKDTVGIEIANSKKTKVSLRELVDTAEWKNQEALLALALGKDVYGQIIVADLARAPHLLVAGTTGSGKSVCINVILASLLLRFPPEELRLLLIDPKVVELQLYNNLPHLLSPVVTDMKKAVPALRYVIDEMERRYRYFARANVRHITTFNRRGTKQRAAAPHDGQNPDAAQLDLGLAARAAPVEEPLPDKLPFVVVIIDELADLMQTAPAEIESCIARIAQKARAAGIHLIVATQTPRADIVTGVIKANIPSRIAFQVASKIDSRVILDQNGAERLLGQGDMLYLPPGTSRLARAQGAFLSDDEVQRLVDAVCMQRGPDYLADLDAPPEPAPGSEEETIRPEDRELALRCWDLILAEEKASTSLLQRKLNLGYVRAARIMDILEEEGCIGPVDGAKPRTIFRHVMPFEA